jgi:16S rRNA (adenine1518-N6/adenine1519-N6)-dimethyltransferase
MDLSQLKFLLKKYKLTPNKVRGQNFLVSDEVLDQILDAAQVSQQDFILEIGPGLGALTQRLVDQASQVVAFEIDKKFQMPLNKLAKVSKNLTIEWQDILSLTDQQWQKILFAHQIKNYKIVSNIPYYLTGKLVEKFISAKHKPVSMTLLVQKEVAERVTLKKNKHSLLSLAVSFYAQSKLAFIVTKDKFYPSPKVDSAILHISDIKAWPYKVDEQQVWQLVHRGMASKRKKLINNLSTDQSLDKKQLSKIFDDINLDQNIRAEDLAVQDWIALADNL